MHLPRPRIELGHQLYPVLEQVRRPEVLWARLASGNYDWLGVRRNGKFVVGRPRLSAVVPDDPAPSPDEARDVHRIEWLGPLQRIPRWEAHATPDQAKDAYLRMVEGDPVTPLHSSGVWKVRLVLDGRSVDERVVVRCLPRLL
jgi:hypothetical protein